jgi:hypothetical protein
MDLALREEYSIKFCLKSHAAEMYLQYGIILQQYTLQYIFFHIAGTFLLHEI